MGVFGGALGILVFPVLIIAAPWYALLTLDEPIPLAISYGGLILVMILNRLGYLIERRLGY